MKLDYAFFAAGADTDADGRLHVFGGEIAGMKFPAFPGPTMPLFLVMKLLDPPGEVGKHRLTVTLGRRGNGELPRTAQEFPVETRTNQLDPDADSGAIVIAQIFMQFPNPGVFEFGIEVDGNCLRSVPFYVSAAPAESNGPINLKAPTARG